jgi:hypothetical protein
MPWRVTLTGRDTGAEYVYELDAPADAHVPVLYNNAAQCHAHERAAGHVHELFGPPMRAEYTEHWKP